MDQRSLWFALILCAVSVLPTAVHPQSVSPGAQRYASAARKAGVPLEIWAGKWPLWPEGVMLSCRRVGGAKAVFIAVMDAPVSGGLAPFALTSAGRSLAPVAPDALITGDISALKVRGERLCTERPNGAIVVVKRA